MNSKKESEGFEILLDRNKLQKNLIFCSLFIMTYENFISSWNDKLLDFFDDSDSIIIKKAKVCDNPTCGKKAGDKIVENDYRSRIIYQ